MTVKFEEDEDKRPEADMTDEEWFDSLIDTDDETTEEVIARLSTKGITVTWLSSDSDGDIDEEAPGGTNTSLEQIGAELAGLSHERTAAFDKGDVVVTLNPYTGDILMYEGEDEDIPRYFEILDVEWDGKDSTYRYLLSGIGKWAAEGWLDVSDLPVMMKTMTEVKGAPSTNAADAMKAQIDALTTEYISNTYLDMMNSEDAEVRTKGLEGLKAMAAEGVI